MSLNEAMERAALAWLADRVSEAIDVVGNPVLSADLEVWLSKMPKYDRHAAGVLEVDDGQRATVARMPQPGDTWTAASLAQPQIGKQVEVQFKNGAAWRGKFEGECDVDRSAIWRYI